MWFQYENRQNRLDRKEIKKQKFLTAANAARTRTKGQKLQKSNENTVKRVYLAGLDFQCQQFDNVGNRIGGRARVVKRSHVFL